MTTSGSPSDPTSVSISDEIALAVTSETTTTYVTISQGVTLATTTLPTGESSDVVIIETQAGPPGESLIGFIYTQSQPSTTWVINHNLGYRPSVELLDGSSREIDGDVYHTTVNQTTILFNIPVAGTARLI